MKTAPWIILSLLFHFLLGLSLVYSGAAGTPFSEDEIIDLTLSNPAGGTPKALSNPSPRKEAPVAPVGTSNLPATTTPVATSEGTGTSSDTGSDAAVGWGEVTRFPKVVKEIKAAYPEEAKKAGVDGPVVMEILIDTSGNVREVKVISGPGFGLNESALEAIKKFEFLPAQKGSEPVTVKIRYTYRFKLGVN